MQLLLVFLSILQVAPIYSQVIQRVAHSDSPSEESSKIVLLGNGLRLFANSQKWNHCGAFHIVWQNLLSENSSIGQTEDLTLKKSQLFQNVMENGEETFSNFISSSILAATSTQLQRDRTVTRFTYKCEFFLLYHRNEETNFDIDKDNYRNKENIDHVDKYSQLLLVGKPSIDMFIFIGESAEQLKILFRSSDTNLHGLKWKFGFALNDETQIKTRRRKRNVNGVTFIRENIAGSGDLKKIELSAIDSENFKIDPGQINLNGVSLKVSGIVLPPYMLLNKKRQIVGGTFWSVFDIASKYFNFTFDMSTDPKPTGTRLKNGTWNGMMGDVLGTKDIGMCIHVTHDRWGWLDFTTYMHSERAFFLMAHPETHVKWNALWSPFTPFLWLLFSISFVLIIPPLFFSFKIQQMIPDSPALQENDPHNLRPTSVRSGNSRSSSGPVSPHSSKSKRSSRSSRRNASNKTLLFDAFYIPFSITLDQDPGKIPTDTTGRVMVALWLVFILVLGTGYKDKLMSFLTFPEEEILPRNLEEVSRRPDFKMIFHFWGSTMLDRFKNKHNPMMLGLGKRLVLERDAAKCVVEATIRQKTLCIGVRTFVSPAMAKNVTLNSAFESYQVSEGLFFPIYLSFPLRKHSIYTGAWDRIAGMYRESTIISVQTRKVFYLFQKQGRSWLMQQKKENATSLAANVYDTLTQMIKNQEGGQENPLVIKHFTVVIIIYIFFHIVCCLIFSWEMLHLVHIDKNNIAGSVASTIRCGFIIPLHQPPIIRRIICIGQLQEPNEQSENSYV